MSEMKHTPGPWLRAESCIYSLMQDGWRKGEPLMVNRVTISTYFHKEVSDEEREATRNLIAAAPELLDELKALYKAYVNTLEAGRDRIISLGGTCDPVDRMEQDDHALLRARQLIAKAQGHAHEGP